MGRIADRRAGRESGYTLTEVLVAIAILSLMFGSVAVGVITSVRATADANDRQRAETLLSAYAESLKQVDYIQCATPARYFDALVDYDENIEPPEDRLSSNPRAELTVTSVDNGCSASTRDAGRQIIDLQVELGRGTAVGQVVKRDPNARPETFNATFDHEVTQGGADVVGLVLTNTTVPVPGSALISYVWEIDGVAQPDNESEVVALVPAVVPSVEVRLTVADDAGRSATVEHPVSIPAALPAPTTTTSPTTTVAPTTTIPSPPEGPAPAPRGFRATGGRGCCPTYGDFEWERVPFADAYLIRMDGFFLGGCVTDHSAIIEDPQWSPTPNGQTTTGRVADFGLCLGSRYDVTIQARVNGVWGQATSMRITL